jgi:hypothetical protein
MTWAQFFIILATICMQKLWDKNICMGMAILYFLFAVLAQFYWK